MIDGGVPQYALGIVNGAYHDTSDKLEHLKTGIDFGPGAANSRQRVARAQQTMH